MPPAPKRWVLSAKKRWALETLTCRDQEEAQAALPVSKCQLRQASCAPVRARRGGQIRGTPGIDEATAEP